MRGNDVDIWESFLFSEGLLSHRTGTFSPFVTEATIKFQKIKNLSPDGIVGRFTLAAAMSEGLSVDMYDDSEIEYTSSWPLRPDFRSPTVEENYEQFGRIITRPKDNLGNVEIVSRDDKYRIVKLEIPSKYRQQAPCLPSAVLVHALVEQPLLGLFEEWYDASLLHLIKTWGGTLAVRYKRGSTMSLSDHAWGSALDFNVQWNLMGRVPALRGKTGSVRELIPIANRRGWFWGGHYSNPDGMHLAYTRHGNGR